MTVDMPPLLQSFVRQDIRSWSRDVLEVPNPHLGGMKACPYAEAAWRNDKVDVVVGNSIPCLKDAIKKFNPKEKDILIWVNFNLNKYERWDRWVNLWNERHKESDTHLMLFHPDFPPSEDTEEFLADNDWESDIEEDYMMIFVQSLSFLNKASVALESSGYYNYFSDDLFQSLVKVRRS
tara:strand:+ start:1687 stop:2223 length:537 start_codon:yes stop_codon:yes gene_type:complete